VITPIQGRTGKTARCAADGVIGRTSRRLANDAGEGQSRAPPLDISDACTLAAISASHILGAAAAQKWSIKYVA